MFYDNFDYVLGIDITSKNSKDFSCVTMICMNCKTIIHTELFKDEEPTLKTPKVCPECGMEFKQGVAIKEGEI